MFQLFSLHRLLEARVGCVASSVLLCTYPHNIITRRKRFCVHNHECIIVHSLIGDLAHSFPVWCEIWLDNLIDIGFLISRRSSNQIKVTEFSNSLTRTPPPPPPQFQTCTRRNYPVKSTHCSALLCKINQVKCVVHECCLWMHVCVVQTSSSQFVSMSSCFSIFNPQVVQCFLHQHLQVSWGMFTAPVFTDYLYWKWLWWRLVVLAAVLLIWYDSDQPQYCGCGRLRL